jgi:hypothetical protein
MAHPKRDIIFECNSWLFGSFFSSDDWDILKKEIKTYSAYSVSKVSVSELSDNKARKFGLEQINYPLTYSCYIRQQSTLPDNKVLKGLR